MESTLLEHINSARKLRKAVAVVTDLTTGVARLVDTANVDDDPLQGEIVSRLKSGKSGIVETPVGETFIQVHVPPLRLVIIGAVHISQALAPMAQACGLDVLVMDPRTAFATAARFEGVALLAQWPQDALNADQLDRFTALVAVTHDPKIDDYPITQALQSECFYIGALGSRKTHGKRCERLSAAGLSETQLARISAPIGLDIGAASPQEIAVAVMAQIIEARRKKASF